MAPRMIRMRTLTVLVVLAIGCKAHDTGTLVAEVELDTDRFGRDFRAVDLASNDPAECRALCEQDARCRAFTLVKPGVQHELARCWLKGEAPAPQPSSVCTASGVRSTPPASQPAPGALTFELDVDRRGFDFLQIEMATYDAELCRAACAADPRCRAYTWGKPGIQGAHAHCWLKSDIPEPT